MEGFCRGCLIKYDEPTDLIPYSEKNRRLFVYSTGLQVKRNDAFTFQLCKDCYFNMKESCKFKKVCRTSEKKFKNYVGLKEDGDTLDFCAYLKNNDESLMLKLPALASGNSTPANHKNKDDDNESTCTSIRNFMSDILQGEEVPDTEARIIKELFEEEADVLDDSLDSHWLQDEDDMSIATDLRMDFSFSAFSTPRSINNDHCYTPHRINDEKYTDKPNKYHNMPLLEVDECAMDIDHVADIPMDNIPNDIYTVNQGNNYLVGENHISNNLPHKNNDLFSKDKETDLGTVLDKGSNILMNKNINTDVYENNHEINISVENGIFNENKELELDISLDKDNNIILKKHFNILNEDQVEEIVEDDSILVKDLLNIEDSTQEFIAPTEIENDFLEMAYEHEKKESDESTIKYELAYYINKVEEKKKHSKNNKCSIDRNLELALLNDQNREFSLEQLISSPRVSINSGASTPTIRNILFGNQTPKYFNLDIHGKTKKLQEELIKEEEISNTDHFSLTGLEPVSTIIDNIKQEILNANKKLDSTTEHSVDDIINLIKEDIYENHEHMQKIKTEIKSEDITELIDDYVTNVYENTDSNAGKNNELDSLLATVIPDLDDPKTPKNDKGIENTDLFKKPIPPDEQYDLENALCKICNKKFNLETALRIHFSKIHRIKITPRKRIYHREQCPQCGKVFRGKANWIRHTKEAHNDIKEIITCKECHLEFKSKYALKQHRRSHNDFVPDKVHEKMLCNFCGKYLNKTNHKLHQLKHQNIYNFKCELCNKSFSRQYDLTRHMGKHTKERPFKCEFCKKAYARREILRKHIAIHVYGYRYECDKCHSRFRTKQAIRKHVVKSLCLGSIVNEKLHVTIDPIVFTPLRKHNKELSDVKIKNSDDKLMNSDNKSKQNGDEPMITDDVHMEINEKNSTNDKQMKTTDDQPVNSKDKLIKRNDDIDKQIFRSADKPMKRNYDIDKRRLRRDDKAMKINYDIDKQRFGIDDKAMKINYDIDKQRFRIDDKPMNKNDDKLMNNSMERTDVTVKIGRITVDIEEVPGGEATGVSIIVDSPISVNDK